MGWDAFAVTSKGKDIKRTMRGEYRPSNPVYDKAFREASEAVKAQGLAVDCLLRAGGLDCSSCAAVLEDMTGLDAWSEKGWTPEEVRAAAAQESWAVSDLDHSRHEPWAFYSAWGFISACARLGLGVRFSW